MNTRSGGRDRSNLIDPCTRPGLRWRIAIAGTILQLCLGTVYAWSYFQKPLVDTFHWTNAQVSWVFSLAIGCLGLAAAVGGFLIAKTGPRTLAMVGGILFGSGYLLAALALHWKSLPWLVIGYGVLGGTGLGLGYVTPVATVTKWFPDLKGMVTGMVIMGFGLGALLMSKVLMPGLMNLAEGDLSIVFMWLGIGLGMVSTICGACLRNPPQTVTPPPTTPTRPQSNHLLSFHFATIWGMFFCNIVAGISIIGFQSPLLQDLLKRGQANQSTASLAAAGSTLIAVSSLFNGLGRILWGAASDRIGRLRAFRLILATQIAAFLWLASTSQPWWFCALICYVLLCYGGGFGTMPALITDRFGERWMPVIYGAVLTAWSAGGIAGPQMIAALKDHCHDQAAHFAFLLGAAWLILGLILSLTLATHTQSPKNHSRSQDRRSHPV